MAISMLKIRRPLGRLIFNMGIAIPGKIVFLIETPPQGFDVFSYQSEQSIEQADMSSVIWDSTTLIVMAIASVVDQPYSTHYRC